MNSKVILWIVLACVVVGVTGYYRVKSLENKNPPNSTVVTETTQDKQLYESRSNATSKDNSNTSMMGSIKSEGRKQAKAGGIKDKIKVEYDKKKDTNINKNTILSTSKAVSLKYLPFLTAFLFITAILGSSRESFKPLTKFSLILAVLSAVGYLILFNIEPLTKWTLEFIDSLKI